MIEPRKPRTIAHLSTSRRRSSLIHAADALVTLERRPQRPASGWILAVDIGGTKVRACLANRRGEVVVETVEQTELGGADELIDQIAALYRQLCARSGVAGIRADAGCIGVPASYHDDVDRAANADNLPGLHAMAPRAAFGRALGIPIAIAQDTRLAAVAERWRGCARGWDDYVVICIGTGVSMGLVINGELYPGGRGEAGEIGRLPIGDGPFPTETGIPRAFETSVSGEGIRRRALIAGNLPATAEELFASAQSGNPTAQRHVEHEAHLISLGIVAVSATIDPGLFVLGGGIGSNPVLLGPVRERVGLAMARPPRIEASVLGDAGPMFGAVAVALSVIGLAR